MTTLENTLATKITYKKMHPMTQDSCLHFVLCPGQFYLAHIRHWSFVQQTLQLRLKSLPPKYYRMTRQEMCSETSVSVLKPDL